MEKKYKVIAALILTLGLAASGYWFWKSTQVNKVYEGEVEILMKEDGYYPSELVIKKGTKITFINKSEYGTWPASDLHPSHSIYSAFDPKGVIMPGEKWSFVFEELGEWGMHDHLAPYITGQIVVVE